MDAYGWFQCTTSLSLCIELLVPCRRLTWEGHGWLPLDPWSVTRVAFRRMEPFLVCKCLASFLPSLLAPIAMAGDPPEFCGPAHTNIPGWFEAEHLARSLGPLALTGDMLAPDAAATATARRIAGWPCRSMPRCLRHHHSQCHLGSLGVRGRRGPSWSFTFRRVVWTRQSAQDQFPHRHLGRLPRRLTLL